MILYYICEKFDPNTDQSVCEDTENRVYTFFVFIYFLIISKN